MSLYWGTIADVVLQLPLLNSVVQHPDAQSRCFDNQQARDTDIYTCMAFVVTTHCLRR
jgi:hypothetical protein